MKELDKVINKIRNLIELAKDKDDQEGVKSMLLARRLMLKHGIEQSQLNIIKSEVIKDMLTFGKNINWWQKILSTVISKHFKVKVYLNREYNGTSIVFLGMTDDVAIAKAVYEQLSTMTEHYSNVFINRYYEESGEYRNRSRTIMLKKSYITGFISGLQEALEEQTEKLMEKYEMVLVTPKEVIDEYNKLSLRTTTVSRPNRVDPSSYSKGYGRGKEYRQTSGNIE